MSRQWGPLYEGHELLRQLDFANEISHAFAAPHLCSEFDWNLSEKERTFSASTRLTRVAKLRAQIDGDICSALGIDLPPEVPKEVDYYNHYFGSSYEPSLPARIWMSYGLGLTFARWDIRYATGERVSPKLSDPFAPSPICPPGMLQNVQGLPVRPEELPVAYPVKIPWDGILVDDPQHSLDIVCCMREVFDIIWKDGAESFEREICEALGVEEIRDYFRKPGGFFLDHLNRYSKSRRQAPIYWPLSTAMGNYTLWIYYPRLTDQTLHAAIADFIDPKIRTVRAEISGLGKSNTIRSRIEELQGLVKELEDFRDEIELIIRLPWKPNLDDGVLITACPLWKLFRLPKWQKDLKVCWQDLENGEYEWARLAHSIWPKRVEGECKIDRAIAVAHELEHLCEVDIPKRKVKSSKRNKKSPVEGEEL